MAAVAAAEGVVVFVNEAVGEAPPEVAVAAGVAWEQLHWVALAVFVPLAAEGVVVSVAAHTEAVGAEPTGVPVVVAAEPAVGPLPPVAADASASSSSQYSLPAVVVFASG